ncbi:hypothetical protein [Kibdelosporangium philippinense]|uniref:hypothetical protein n=1 Tax=Kibdelosporangium philippinense TaxID=211113 RepID=UPI003613001B
MYASGGMIWHGSAAVCCFFRSFGGTTARDVGGAADEDDVTGFSTGRCQEPCPAPSPVRMRLESLPLSAPPTPLPGPAASQVDRP